MTPTNSTTPVENFDPNLKYSYKTVQDQQQQQQQPEHIDSDDQQSSSNSPSLASQPLGSDESDMSEQMDINRLLASLSNPEKNTYNIDSLHDYSQVNGSPANVIENIYAERALYPSNEPNPTKQPSWFSNPALSAGDYVSDCKIPPQNDLYQRRCEEIMLSEIRYKRLHQLQKNREFAKKSRFRKKQEMSNLNTRLNNLIEENKQLQCQKEKLVESNDQLRKRLDIMKKTIRTSSFK